MRASRVTPSKFDVRRGISWGMASVLMGLVAYPPIEARLGAMRAAARLEKLEANPDRLAGSGEWMDSNLSLRVQRLGPLLASWETIGGCGAGGTGGSVGVKWIGHNTTGGLFHSTLMLNYLAFNNGYNLIALAQLDRDIDQGQKWNVGVIVPVLYKYYSNYLQVRPPVSISNSGLMIDHTIDESWGLIVLGGLGAYRGGRNDLGSYRAPTGTLYSYAGYFLGPLVPALGVSVTGFTGKDQDRGIDQDLPLVLIAGNASIEWSTDWIAILAGVSFSFSTDAQLQPWLVALGVSVSPF
jgi:hypothetical protein